MHPTFTFDADAFARVQRILSLRSDDIAHMLATDRCLVIGRTGLGNIQILFWSQDDRKFFVAEVIELERRVISIELLTRNHPKVEEDDLLAMISQSSRESACKRQRRERRQPTNPQNYIFTFSLGRPGAVPRIKRVKIPVSDFPSYVRDPTGLERERALIERLQFLIAQEIQPGENLLGIRVSSGQNAWRLPFNLP